MGRQIPYLEASNLAVDAYHRQNHDQAIAQHFGKERQSRKEMDAVVGRLVEDVGAEKKAAEADLADQQAVSTMIQISFSVVGILLAIVFGFYLVRTIVLPLQRVNKQLQAIADGNGDLTRSKAT